MRGKFIVLAYIIAIVVIVAIFLFAYSILFKPQPKISYSFNYSRQVISGNITDTLGYPIQFDEFYCRLHNGSEGLFPIGNNITLNSSQEAPFIITVDKNLTENCTSVGVNYKKI